MSHTTPAVNLVWALITVMLGSFLVSHLWSFDRFACLKWNHGPRSGAFKRVMTYSYLTSVPLIIIYAIGFAIIKYHYGFTVIPGMGIIPTPYELWSNLARSAILPLYLCFSLAWGLEMVTHLEELCFWLFLVNSESARQDWFRSPYFKTWAFGSCVAVLYMPLVTIFTRQDPYKCEAYTFLAGSIGSLSLTIWFLPVLWTFPSFLEDLKHSNVEMNTLVRLTKFHELNCIRIVFRFLFTIPFVILGIDGVRPHQHINDKMLPTDLLAMVAGIGCVVSSGITLVIFFPRSIEGEMAKKEQARERRQQSLLSRQGTTHHSNSQNTHLHSHVTVNRIDANYSRTHSRPHHNRTSAYGLPSYDAANGGGDGLHAPSRPMNKETTDDFNLEPDLKHVAPTMTLQPNRRMRDGDVELGTVVDLTDVALERHKMNLKGANVNDLVHNWRSPIDLGGDHTW
ncbi:hypothetical protein BS17DRAFT_783656 [Gyrodon lividus]|nr:hypothetical protein BS17DRAFT_783656 [Gyrodon lividus]